MADLLTRMRLDSAEYDQKLKRAQQNLLAFEQQCRSAGESMSSMSKENVEYVRALGNMETVSKNAKQRISELTQAFTELSIVYNRMSEEEKQGDVGKALSSSLDQLKTRIGDAKKELNDVGRELGDVGNVSNETGGILESLAGKFGMNIKQLAGWGTAIAAAKGAMEVAKDAFFKNEQQLDEWGRVVETSKTLYGGFLDALNTGDISGYLSNIGTIIRAARNAYDALDELGTFNAFNQINVQKTRTGMADAIVDYREGNATKDQVRAAADAYKKELKQRQELERKAYLEKIKEVAAERGVSYDDLRKALSGTYGDYKKLQEVQPTGTTVSRQGSPMFGGGYVVKQQVPVNDLERMGDALRRFNDTELNALQALGAQAERTAYEMTQADRQVVRVLNGRGTNSPSGGGGSRSGQLTEKLIEGGIPGLKEIDIETKVATESMRELQAALKYFKDQLMTATTAAAYQSATSGIAATERKIEAQPMALKFGMDAESMADIQEQMKAFGEELQSKIKPVTIKLTTEKAAEIAADGKDITNAWQAASGAIGKVGSAMESIQDPTAKVAGLIAKAIASVVAGAGQAISAKDTTSSGWAWIGAAAAIAAEMVTIVGTIHSITSKGYATGGIVDGRGGGFITGNSFSGDNIGNVNLDAGELVLTRSQQGSLAAVLSGQQNSNSVGYARVNGEQIYIALQRYMRRAGHGEIVTFK